MKWASLNRICNELRVFFGILAACGLPSPTWAQSIRVPWSDYAHDPQHTALSPAASQPLGNRHWQTPVDLNPQHAGGNPSGDLYIHYGSPLITRSNTVIVPVKTGAFGGFRIEALVGTNGVLKWMQSTDYVLPPTYDWTPSFSGTLTPKNRLYFPGAGGRSTTAIHRMRPTPPPSGRSRSMG